MSVEKLRKVSRNLDFDEGNQKETPTKKKLDLAERVKQSRSKTEQNRILKQIPHTESLSEKAKTNSAAKVVTLKPKTEVTKPAPLTYLNRGLSLLAIHNRKIGIGLLVASLTGLFGYTLIENYRMKNTLVTLEQDLIATKNAFTELQESQKTVTTQLGILDDRLKKQEVKTEELKGQTIEIIGSMSMVNERLSKVERDNKEAKTLWTKITEWRNSLTTNRTPIPSRSASTYVNHTSYLNRTINVKATAYGPDCKGCSGVTATGKDVRTGNHRVIAVDPKVIPLGSKVELFYKGRSLGYFTAEDTGSAIKGNRIDILYPTEELAKQFGVRDLTVKILN